MALSTDTKQRTIEADFSGRNFSIRALQADDLQAVAHLLTTGFPERSLDYWRRGFDRFRFILGDRSLGWCLVRDNQIDGVVLTLQRPNQPDGSALYNVSSWYVRPAARGYSMMLAKIASAERDSTYVNLSPAPFTRPVITRLGFRSINEDTLLLVPLLMPRNGLRAEAFDATRHSGRLGSKAKIAEDHSLLGCHVFVVNCFGKLFLFIFQNTAISFLKVAAVRAIFIDNMSIFRKCAWSLAWMLAARGRLLIKIDGSRVPAGQIGLAVKGGSPRWCKGPRPPQPNDLCYSEMVIFGP